MYLADFKRLNVDLIYYYFLMAGTLIAYHDLYVDLILCRYIIIIIIIIIMYLWM
jgi:hypothetical protein